MCLPVPPSIFAPPQGQGVARQRQAIITGLRDSVKDFDSLEGITPKDVVELMLITQVCVGVCVTCV